MFFNLNQVSYFDMEISLLAQIGRVLIAANTEKHHSGEKRG